MTSITCQAVTPPTCKSTNAFINVNKSIPLYVPAESVEAYKEAYAWKEFTNILAIPVITWQNYDGSELQSSEVKYGTLPEYTGPTPTKPADAEYTYTFAGWTPAIVAVTGDATYTASYNETKNSYTITWLDDDGSTIDQTIVEYGQTPTHADPTKPADAEYTYTFAGWTPAIVAVIGDATYTASFNSYPVPAEIVIHDGESLDICTLGYISVQKVIVEPDGELTINSSCVHIDSLILMADGLRSGQIHHGGAGLDAEHFILEYILNSQDTKASPSLWYAFAVPFEVAINGGISRTCDDKPLVSGTDFLIMEYNGLLRALQGKGWEKKLTGTLEPGRFYMLGIDGNCNRWRFEKTGSTFEGLISQQLQAFGSDNAANNPLNIGWNSLGNTRLEYSGLSNLSSELSSLLYAVTYDNRFSKYETHLLSDLDLFVGQPFFLQTSYDGTFDFHYNCSLHMPALRAPKAPTPMMHFTLSDEESSDNLYLTLHDDATGTYTIGRDVARMSTDCKTAAQLWCVSAEGTQLTAHGIAEPEKETMVDVALFAPKKGEYVLRLDASRMDEYQVELLYQGAYVATLFDAQPLKVELNAGNNTGYALRVRGKMPTGLWNAQSDKVQSTKMLIDNQLYIVQGEHIYDAQGKKVK